MDILLQDLRFAIRTLLRRPNRRVELHRSLSAFQGSLRLRASTLLRNSRITRL